MFWRPDISISSQAQITIKRDILTDPARGGRSVPFKLFLPEQATGALPLILWSHGLGGGRDGANFLSRFLAGYGYAVLHLQHPGTDTSLWEGKPGHPWDVIRATHIPHSASLERFADVPFALEAFPAWCKGRDDVPPIDFYAAGMSGHSFGALTTQVMAGQLYPDEAGTLQSFHESRFRAGILYSPVPSLKFGPEIYAPIDLPLLHMTGTADDSPIETFGFKERLAVYDHSGKAEKALLILKDGDHMVYNGSRGQLAENPHRAAHETIIKVIALAWWDAHLKGDTAAKEWLHGGGVKAFLDGRGEFR